MIRKRESRLSAKVNEIVGTRELSVVHVLVRAD